MNPKTPDRDFRGLDAARRRPRAAAPPAVTPQPAARPAAACA